MKKRALEAQQRELAALPGRIEALEKEQQQLVEAMASPEFYQRAESEITADANRLKEMESELARSVSTVGRAGKFVNHWVRWYCAFSTHHSARSDPALVIYKLSSAYTICAG